MISIKNNKQIGKGNKITVRGKGNLKNHIQEGENKTIEVFDNEVFIDGEKAFEIEEEKDTDKIYMIIGIVFVIVSLAINFIILWGIAE